jgi:hypothetical protein
MESNDFDQEKYASKTHELTDKIAGLVYESPCDSQEVLCALGCVCSATLISATSDKFEANGIMMGYVRGVLAAWDAVKGGPESTANEDNLPS